MFHNPLQHASMRKSGHNHKQHTHSDDRSAAEARESILSIKYTCNIEHADGSKKNEVAAPLGKQQNSEHTQHRNDGDPGVKTKA